MAADELVELRFRLADGSDIGPSKYSSGITVTSLKEAQWPKDKDNGPKSTNDIKLINAGKILEDNRTLAELRLPLSEVPGGVITMHVVVRPPLPDKNHRIGFVRTILLCLPVLFALQVCWTSFRNMTCVNRFKNHHKIARYGVGLMFLDVLLYVVLDEHNPIA